MAREKTELLEMGERIRELRKLHGFKQQWIADQIGVQLRTYQFWQAGKSPPEQENLEKLAALFGVEPKYILNGETPELPMSRDAQLTRIEEKVDQLCGLLLGDGEPVADVAVRLLKATGWLPPKADEPMETERADDSQPGA